MSFRSASYSSRNRSLKFHLLQGRFLVFTIVCVPRTDVGPRGEGVPGRRSVGGRRRRTGWVHGVGGSTVETRWEPSVPLTDSVQQSGFSLHAMLMEHLPPGFEAQAVAALTPSDDHLSQLVPEEAFEGAKWVGSPGGAIPVPGYDHALIFHLS